MAVVALFSVVANVGMAIVPSDEWNTTQALNYVDAQATLSNLTGHPLQSQVHRGSRLPPWGPAGQLFVVGNCSGLYVSNGEDYSTVPSQQYQRATWMTVELGRPFQHGFSLAVTSPAAGQTRSVPLLSAGPYTVSVHGSFTTKHTMQLRFEIFGGSKILRGPGTDVSPGTSHTVIVTTDPVKHDLSASFDGVTQVSMMVPRGARAGPVRVNDDSHSGPQSSDGVVVSPMPIPRPTLCQSLIG
jgi:hypothetical protein